VTEFFKQHMQRAEKSPTPTCMSCTDLGTLETRTVVLSRFFHPSYLHHFRSELVQFALRRRYGSIPTLHLTPSGGQVPHELVQQLTTLREALLPLGDQLLELRQRAAFQGIQLLQQLVPSVASFYSTSGEAQFWGSLRSTTTKRWQLLHQMPSTCKTVFRACNHIVRRV